jgi:hypothetical protein
VIGTIFMDVSHEQMIAMVEHWWNCRFAYLENQKTKVIKVHQRSNGRFVVELEGNEKQKWTDAKIDQVAVVTVRAVSGD